MRHAFRPGADATGVREGEILQPQLRDGLFVGRLDSHSETPHEMPGIRDMFVTSMGGLNVKVRRFVGKEDFPLTRHLYEFVAWAESLDIPVRCLLEDLRRRK